MSDLLLLRYENAFTFGAASGHGFSRLQPCGPVRQNLTALGRWCLASGAKALLLNAFLAARLKPAEAVPCIRCEPGYRLWRN